MSVSESSNSDDNSASPPPAAADAGVVAPPPPPEPAGAPPPPDPDLEENDATLGADDDFGDQDDGTESQTAAYVDDFDFSFGEESASPGPQAPVAGSLGDLFDDLDDLPAPKVNDGSAGFTDLPGLKGDHHDLPGLKDSAFSDLPGLRRATEDASPVEVPEVEAVEAPVDGLMAPEAAEEIPELPNDDAAHLYAATGAQVAGTGGAPASDSDGRKRLVLALAAILIIGGAVAGMMVAEVGPFEASKNVKPTKRAAATKDKAKTKSVEQSTAQTEEPKTAEPLVEPAADGLTAAAAPTLAEWAGFRSAIGALEAKKTTLDGAGKLGLIELYAQGALEYPENDAWLKSAHMLMKSLSEEEKNLPSAKRVTLTLDAAAEKEGAVAAALAGVKDSKAAEDQYLRGYVLSATGNRKAALKAYGAAYAANPKALNAQRMAGRIAMESGLLKEAKKIFEGLYAQAPGAPVVNTDLAAIESRLGKDARAESLLTQVFKLKPGRARSEDRSAAFLLRARLRTRLGRPGPAAKDLESAVRAWPRNIGALNLLARQHFIAGDYDKALDRFQGLVKAGFRSPQLSMKVAECFGKMGRVDRAVEEIEEALHNFPDSAGLHATLGDIQVRKRDFPKAREAYEKAIELDAGHGGAHLKLSEMLVKESKVKEAIVYLEGAIEKNQRNGVLHLGLADLKKRMAKTSGNRTLLEQARQGYESAVKTDPSLVNARRNLVSVLLTQGHAARALEELEHLAQRPDFHEEMSYEFGQATQSLGRLDTAIAHYEKAIEKEPGNAGILLHAGSTWFEKKSYEQAKVLLKKSAAINPKELQAHFFLGRIALIEDQHQEAIQRFKQSLELDKRNYENRYWLGRALEASGDEDQRNSARQEYDLVAQQAIKDKALIPKLCDVFLRRAEMEMVRFSEWQAAINDLDRYLDCNPGHADAFLKRGSLRDKMGDLKKAESDFKSAIKADPKFGQAYSNLAYTQLRSPRPNEKKIRKLLEKAVRYNQDLARPHYTLCTMIKERDKAGARKHCEAYLRLEPAGDYATEAKELLRSL